MTITSLDFEGIICAFVDFKGENLKGANFTNSKLRFSNFNDAILAGAIFAGANLEACSLIAANLINASLTRAFLGYAKLTEANLTNADLRFADFIRCDLRGANLSGANLSGANLSGSIGLGTREGEVKFAKRLLKILESGRGHLEMGDWQSCATAHCLAGWRLPTVPNPEQKASLLCPTLAQFFYSDEEEALKGLKLVVTGKLSVFSD